MASASSSSPCDEISSNKKFTSNIWNFFDRIEIILENNKKEIKAKCKISYWWLKCRHKSFKKTS